MLITNEKRLGGPLAFFLFLFFSILWPSFAVAETADLLAELEKAFVAISEQASPAIVSISTEKTSRSDSYTKSPGEEILDRFFREFLYGEIPRRKYTQIWLGSGVLVEKNGYILTNEHIVAGAEKITVTLSDGREFTADIKGTDSRTDVAVIKIEAENLPCLALADSDGLKPGQMVLAMGNPFAFGGQSPKPIITSGIISGVHRSLPRTANRGRGYLNLIQTNAAINPGNSGGALLNIRGEIVGINVEIFSSDVPAQGIGFAIPVNDTKVILDKLLNGEELLGKRLGIEVQDVNRGLADYFKLRKPEGVLVSQVAKAGVGARAGLHPEDIIIKFNEQKVKNSLDFLKIVSRAKPDETVKLKIIRNSIPRTLKLKMGEPSSAEKKAPESIAPGPNNIKLPAESPVGLRFEQWRGIKITEISDEFAGNFDLDNQQGVIVTDVAPDSPAEAAGIKINDIITQVNTLAITTLDDYYRAINASSGNVLLKTNRGYLMVQE
ncbi:MAG: trypsin-like peptidase domain-containing protein [Candidatus Omnitrophica bacterium]|nr:trypsin-like peptidase domain-containing protein [Candidatus Omnitrophota bacterium]